MGEFLHPGVYIRERFEVPPAIPGVGVSTGAQVGVTKRGPIDRALIVTSFAGFERRYGGYYNDEPLPFAVKGFFDNGGTRLAIGRVVGTGAVAATKSLTDFGGNSSLKVTAADPGEWANGLGVTTTKAETKLAAALALGSQNEVTVDSVAGFEVGDTILVSDGTDEIVVVIHEIDFTAKKLKFADTTVPGDGMIIGDPVLTTTTHRAVTRLAEAAGAADTSIKVVSAGGIVIGSILAITDGPSGNEAVHRVISINGTTIGLDAAVGAAFTTPASTVVASQEFDLKVYLDDLLVDTIRYLSMEDLNKADFVEERVAGRNNESIYIELEDLDSASTPENQQIPRGNVKTLLTGGVEGTAPTDSELIGTSTPGAKTGIYLMDPVDEAVMLSIPGHAGLTLDQALDLYCINRGDINALLQTEADDKTDQAAYEYRTDELSPIDSHRCNLYWPYLVVYDPVRDKSVEVSPVGHLQGIWARVATERGVHKAPANEIVRGIQGIVTDDQNIDFDTAQDLLNPVGVNVIRPIPGRGIRVYGARTLWGVPDGRHYVSGRRLLDFVEESMEEGLGFAVHEPNDATLATRAEASVTSFLYRIWAQGLLGAPDDPRQAYFVDVGAGVNTPASIAAGEFHIKAGVRLVPPAEFVVFTITRIEGQLSVSEA